MKSVKISDVHYEMLRDLGKKYRLKVEDLIEELIQENYANQKEEMKGSYQRYVERELNRARTANENQMLRYQETLKKVADAVGTTVPFKTAPEGVEQQIRPNTVYAVRCSDREEYYRTVYLKPNPFTSNLDLAHQQSRLRGSESRCRWRPRRQSSRGRGKPTFSPSMPFPSTVMEGSSDAGGKRVPGRYRQGEGAEQGSEAGRQVPEGEEAHEDPTRSLRTTSFGGGWSPRTSGHPTPTSRTARNWRSA